eukprot:scaffold119689_cov45-Phaeocystis_antarctica.AAC.1
MCWLAQDSGFYSSFFPPPCASPAPVRPERALSLSLSRARDRAGTTHNATDNAKRPVPRHEPRLVAAQSNMVNAV